MTVRGPRIIRGTSTDTRLRGPGGFGSSVGGSGTWSLASIAPRPRFFVIVALTASPIPTKKSSVGSDAVSSSTVIVIDFELSPGANESVPVRAEKSEPAFAVASIVLKLTVTVRRVVPASVTVNVAPAPSRAIASLIESDGGAFLSTIVPSPWPSSTLLAGMPDGLERLTLRVSFSSVVAVAEHRHRDRLRELAGSERQLAAAGGVVRRLPSPCRRPSPS